MSLSFFEAMASHIVGGEFTYVYLGDSISGGAHYNKYKVSLSIYEDCLNGEPQAILQDNPAFLAAYSISHSISGTLVYTPYNLDTNVNFISDPTVPVNFNNSCVSNIPATCLIKKTFVKTYAFLANAYGYVISYQRCCRNASVANIEDPGDQGSTYYCVIPPGTIINNSAVFKNYPPQIICLNNPLYYDNSATDADDDSLSYGFCSALVGANESQIKPYPLSPPFDSVQYISPYSSQAPFTGYPPIQINPVTGIITGTPNRIGRYLVTVFCNEYRHGCTYQYHKKGVPVCRYRLFKKL